MKKSRKGIPKVFYLVAVLIVSLVIVAAMQNNKVTGNVVSGNIIYYASLPVYVFTAGFLPPDLYIDSSTGVMSGIPIADGDYSFTITATSGGYSGNKDYSLHVDCPVIDLSPTSLSGGIVNQPYTQTLTAADHTGPSTGPFTFTVTSGSLPTGLTLASGTISGTPTVTGSSTFEITAHDAYTCIGKQTYTISINNADPCASSCSSGVAQNYIIEFDVGVPTSGLSHSTCPAEQPDPANPVSGYLPCGVHIKAHATRQWDGAQWMCRWVANGPMAMEFSAGCFGVNMGNVNLNLGGGWGGTAAVDMVVNGCGVGSPSMAKVSSDPIPGCPTGSYVGSTAYVEPLCVGGQCGVTATISNVVVTAGS